MLAGMGVTFLVSSGDEGVMFGSSTGCQTSCTTSSSKSATPWTGSNTWTGYGYFPSFPATSPYVTAVGATMGSTNVVPNAGESERACQVSEHYSYSSAMISY